MTVPKCTIDKLCKNLRTTRLGQNLLVLIKKSVYSVRSGGGVGKQTFDTPDPLPSLTFSP